MSGDPPRGTGSEVEVAIPITGDLDLHSFAPREIPSVVEEYVHACRERGVLRLRLAHGRGKGVQRAAVRRQLASMSEVRSFEDAPPGAGGWGATVAELHPLTSPSRSDTGSDGGSSVL